jgi:DNA polymerase III epsilon subunit-like protein
MGIAQGGGLDPSSFAVVDCETTGLHPSRHHRIIELAIVGLGADWQPQDIWCTLLSPERDLGPTGIHGIRGRDVCDAPTFDAVVGDVLDRLAGRVVVAHNARFDGGFLEHELLRLGMNVSPLPTLCTMRLAGELRLGGGRSRLGDCCAAVGVTASGSHTAEGDALACAGLLAECVRASKPRSVEEAISGRLLPQDSWPKSESRAPCRTRGEIAGEAQEPSFLAGLVKGIEVSPGADTLRVAPYLDVLDRAIEDRLLSSTEQDELAAAATALGLSADRVRKLHSDYVATLVALARRDGVVTDRERADLILVAEALGIAGVKGLLDRPLDPGDDPQTAASGLAGKSVCFTGALMCHYEGALVTRELAQELAEAAGMVVAPRVTKKLDMLVVADPDSLSGKAKKAREYDTRIVAETAFWSMIGIEVT